MTLADLAGEALYLLFAAAVLGLLAIWWAKRGRK